MDNYKLQKKKFLDNERVMEDIFLNNINEIMVFC